MTVPGIIKNIIFDMGGVLVPLDPARCRRAFEALGAFNTAAYVRDFRTEDLFHDIETGAMTTPEFCSEVRRIDSLGVSDGEITAAWDALLLPSDDVRREGLLRLKSAGFRLFLLSNTCDIHWQSASKKLIPAPGRDINDYFERCFLSYELHARKPSPGIYAEALRLAGIKAPETLFVDDNAANTAAAEKLGMRVFHERPGHTWTEFLEGELS